MQNGILGLTLGVAEYRGKCKEFGLRANSGKVEVLLLDSRFQGPRLEPSDETRSEGTPLAVVYELHWSPFGTEACMFLAAGG